MRSVATGEPSIPQYPTGLAEADLTKERDGIVHVHRLLRALSLTCGQGVSELDDVITPIRVDHVLSSRQNRHCALYAQQACAKHAAPPYWHHRRPPRSAATCESGIGHGALVSLTSADRRCVPVRRIVPSTATPLVLAIMDDMSGSAETVNLPCLRETRTQIMLGSAPLAGSWTKLPSAKR